MAPNFDELPQEVQERLRLLLEAGERAKREVEAKKRRERLQASAFVTVILLAGATGAVVAAMEDPGADPYPMWVRITARCRVCRGDGARVHVQGLPAVQSTFVLSDRDSKAIEENAKMDQSLQVGCAVVVNRPNGSTESVKRGPRAEACKCNPGATTSCLAPESR